MTTGGCLCGAIRFEYSGDVGAAGYCHCEDCRRVTGSAFNVGVGMQLDAFTLTQGKTNSFTKTADSGNELTRHFCGNCGSPLYTASPRHPEVIYVKAGVIDDPSVVKPADQAWLRSAVEWAHIPADIPGREKGRS